MKHLSQPLLRYLTKVAAYFCFALGVIGIFVPVLPTTPFLILATFLSFKSSPKLRRYLLRHPVFGTTIRNYLRHRAITTSTLRAALTSLWLCLAVSIILIHKLWLTLLLVVIGIGVSWYLLSLKREDAL
jgi:uncharacterized membrane protein YbaN (DUF454 family)